MLEGGSLEPYPAPEQELTPESSGSLWDQVVGFINNVFNPPQASLSHVPAVTGNESILMQSAATHSVQIDYQYDALNRLISANYGDGTSFHYTYDAAGNTLETVKTISGQTKTTVYTYDADNQIQTAQENGGTVWQYLFDGNGSLTESRPGSQPGNGAKRYSYDSAGQLVKVEAHDGTTYQPQAEMTYNGLSQRTAVSAYASGQSLTSTYILDDQTLLSATAAGETTYYLPGIGEEKQDWTYYLADGLNNTRLLTDEEGLVFLTRSYTPWGEVLEQAGSGELALGYLGGVLDAATGLIYVGNGQYYDPATGRFLSRGTNSGAPNPYVPWQGNPLGMIVGPLALLVLVRGKRKGGKIDQFLVILIVALAVSLTVSSCTPGDDGTPTPPPSMPPSSPTEPQPTQPGGGSPTPTQSPTRTPTPTPTCIPTQSPSPMPTNPPIINCDELPGGAPSMCKTYLVLRDNPGWWNGDQEGNLSPQKFLGLLLRMELNNSGGCGANLIDYNTQVEMAVRNFYAHCRDYEGCTNNSLSTSDIFICIDKKKLLWERPEMILDTDISKAKLALWKEDRDYYSNADFEFGFLHPGEWVDGWGKQNKDGLYTAPFDWGNISTSPTSCRPAPPPPVTT